jgi:predicted O-linked N-acetylglucosamine transferase (SPINDLY family)
MKPGKAAAPKAAAAHRPGACATQVQRALGLERAGRVNEAAELLMQVVQEFPREPEPYLRLGNLLATQGHWDSAEVCYANRCALAPQDATSHYNWGVALQELGRLPEAIEAFERAIGLNSQYAAAFFALGLAYQRLEALDATLLALECAVNLNPLDAGFRIERARTLLKLGRFADALAELEALPQHPPRAAEAFNLQGIALKHLHRVPEALACYDEAIRLQPDFVEALNNRGNLRLLLRQFSPALQDFERAQALKPDVDWLAGLRLYAALHLYDWTGLDAARRALLVGVAEGRRVVQPLTLQCIADDPLAQQRAARIWTQAVSPPRDLPAPAPAASDKIRVAYISRDFKSHPVSFLMAEVFELHDRERFEIIALNYGSVSGDAMQQRLRGAFDRFLDVEDLSERQIAELARSLQVDIAVDLTGLTEGARSGIFAWRAAPVQVLYLGYLGTAGSPNHDYLIADATLVAPQARACFDEKLMVLPSYQANDRRRPTPALSLTRAELGLPETGFVYCCFNNPSKITPEVFGAWATILMQVPDAVLWVLEEDDQAAHHLRRHAQMQGIEPARIIFARRAAREAYLASLRAADLFLDTLPYNAGTTASDALWMGLPVLTRIGQAFAGRVAASLLRAVDLPALIAHDADEYIATAVRLAREPAELAAVKDQLRRSRDQAALFDAPRFTRHLESAYREAHRLRVAGEAFADIVVADAA